MLLLGVSTGSGSFGREEFVRWRLLSFGVVPAAHRARLRAGAAAAAATAVPGAVIRRSRPSPWFKVLGSTCIEAVYDIGFLVGVSTHGGGRRSGWGEGGDRRMYVR